MGIYKGDRSMKITYLATIFLSQIILASAGFRGHKPTTTTHSPRIETAPPNLARSTKNVRLSDCFDVIVNINQDSGYVYLYNYGSRARTCRLHFSTVANKFYTFEIKSYNTRCSYIYNEMFAIYSGTSAYGQSLFDACTSTRPSYIETSSSNAVVVVQIIRQGIVYFTFQTKSKALATQITPACIGNGLTLTGSSGEGHSPGYLTSGSGKYNDNLDCVWRINAKAGTVISLKIESISIENSYSCSRDYLNIYNGNDMSNLYGKYCGTLGGFAITSKSNSLLLVFHSNQNVGYNGFKFSYKEISFDPCVVGQTIRAETGTIQSPNYPNFYGNNLDCHWTIESPSNSALDLSFDIHSIEHHSSCQNDYLDVYDGPDTKSQFVVRYCGNGKDRLTLGKSAHLHLHTNNYNHQDKFIINFEKYDPSKTTTPARITTTTTSTTTTTAATTTTATTTTAMILPSQSVNCDASYVATTTPQSFKSEGFKDDRTGSYPNNMDCTYTFLAGDNQGILLQFVSVVLEYSYDCTKDFIKIFDLSGTQIDKICGYRTAITHRIDTRSVSVQFVTDNDQSLNGFHMDYSAYDRQPSGVYQGNQVNQPTQADTLECGRSQRNILSELETNRIVGGSEANAHSLPWQVLIRIQQNSLCGGIIVGQKWILTAAHCAVSDKIHYEIQVGKHHRDRSDSGQRSLTIKSITKHPSYNGNVADGYDIALFELNENIVYGSTVQPICIPRTSVQVGRKCLTSGWGTLSQDSASTSAKLMQVYLPILSNTDCRNKYRDHIDDTMICAGQGGRDACKGDSGGPLACLVNGHWEVHGVTSWGKGCAQQEFPGVWARVSHFASWIHSTTGGAVKFSS